jgi:NADH-quinone oxidoreductase subunit J
MLTGIEAAFFYLFAFIAVAAAFMVIAAKNPVHSVLFLILTFFNAAGLFLLSGAEFLAMILLVVYVGAVAVLFLFVVMMLDVDFAELKTGILQYAPIGLVVGAVLFLELLLVAGSAVISPEITGGAALPIDGTMDNTRALGQVLYTRYVFLFQGAAAVLLVAMIGAIVLTLRHRTGVKRQSTAAQIGRRAEETVRNVKVKSGQGL